MRKFTLFTVLMGLALLCGAFQPARKAAAVRYVNPLSIDDVRSIADPAVIRFQGKYYLFLSGGFAWSSDDLVHWTHQPVSMPGGRRVTAPNIFEYRGKLYLSGNDT